ncbi:hypothetical protein AAFF_G00204420 [Aldrovandia affinis]|uniref:Pre-mRNA-splicing factor 38B n=1 Tax=Aldrovandia affinis TaxID=143900 RepID=A0AAD7RI53_9TELE|nr:hypothetical protein AAFF_G00204420 [Aldrovandia affinis]
MANNTALAGNPQQQQQAVNKPAASGKQGNVLPLWGNEKTMNLNPMILTNVLSSPYFKVQLYELKTYHEVVDEIYFKVIHVEPWEKGSRKTAGQTGMCGGVRGVGTGGIVSTAFCLLYKLFTLKLTRKQVMGLITHTDSPYIRALGFMYIRYTQPPPDLLDWFDGFLDDEEISLVQQVNWKLYLNTVGLCVSWTPEDARPADEEQTTEDPLEGGQGGGGGAGAARRAQDTQKNTEPPEITEEVEEQEPPRDGHSSAGFDWELERERERQRKEREGKDCDRDRDRDRGERAEKDRDRSERDKGDKERRRSRSADRAPERRGSRGKEPRRSCSRSRDRKNNRKDREKEREREREGEGDRSRRKVREHDKNRASDRDKDGVRERSRDGAERTKDKRAKGEAEDRRHRDERKVKKRSQSRSRERKHRSRSHAKHRGERPGKRSRSKSRGQADGVDKARKSEQSHSKERPHHREHSNSKEQPLPAKQQHRSTERAERTQGSTAKST